MSTKLPAVTTTEALKLLASVFENSYDNVFDVKLEDKPSDKIHIDDHTIDFVNIASGMQVVPFKTLTLKVKNVHDLLWVHITAQPVFQSEIRFMVSADFVNRPACQFVNQAPHFRTLLGFGDVLRIVRDLVSNRANPIIDASTRIRLEDIMPYAYVMTGDCAETIIPRRSEAKTNFDLNIMHETLLSLNSCSIIVEQHKNYDDEVGTVIVFRIGKLPNEIARESDYAHDCELYFDERDVHNVIHMLEQLYADDQVYEVVDNSRKNPFWIGTQSPEQVIVKLLKENKVSQGIIDNPTNADDAIRHMLKMAIGKA